MSNEVSLANHKQFFQETEPHPNEQSCPIEFDANQPHHRQSQQLNKKPMPTFFKPNQFNQSSETIKHLLLERFKHKKQVLLQSTSIYIDTGEIKKKNSTKDKAQIVSQIKNTSLEKLPFLSKDRHKKPHVDRLSQTIDAYSEMNKSISSEVTSNPSWSTLESSTNLGKAKLHLSKRKSLHQPNEIGSSFVVDNVSGERKSNQISPKSSPLFLGFDQEIRKKYFKSIVDRYFPNEQSPERQTQLYAQRQPRDIKQLKKYQNSNNKPTIVSTDKLLKQNKLPLLNHSKFQSINNSRQTRSQSISENLQSEILHDNPAQSQKYQFENMNQQIITSNSSALSLSQSYLLEKIQEDQEETQAPKGEDFYNSNRLQNRSASQYFSHLTHQSSSQAIMNSSCQDLLHLAKSSLSSLESQNKQKQQKVKIYENRSFSILKIKHTSFQNLSKNHNLKTLSVSYELRKYFLTEASMELKRRQLRAKQIILSQCGPCFGQMWQEDMFDNSCIKLNITKNSPPCCSGKLLPLTISKMLYKISPQMQSGAQSFLIIKPSQTQKPTPFVTQHTLLMNSHSDLLALILNVAIPFSQVSGNLINNKLSLNNLFYRDYNSYSVNEWSYSYFRQDFMIQDKQFEKRLEPILKNEFGEWFVTPEYLAPEILENLCYSRDQVVKYWVKREGKKMEKSIVKEHDLFEYGNKADVWSLGLLILEIITLIPVWIAEKCIVQNRTNPSIKPRRGLLYAEKRDVLKILTKQSYLKENLNKIIRIESEPYQIQEWLITLLHRMLDLDAQKRISFEQIVEELKARLKK